MPAPEIDLSVPALDLLHQRRSEKWEEHPADVMVSTIAEMDFPVAPPIAEALRAALDRSDLGYGPAEPTPLFEAFAAFAGRRMGWTVDPTQVTIAPDVMSALLDLSATLAGPNCAVTFATPAYPPFHGAPSRVGLSVHPVGLTADGQIDLEALEAELASGTRVFLLANPHNPTGRVLPRDELFALAEVCARHEAWVIADEIHAPLVLSGATHTPWLEVSDAARERGISLTSASKAFNLAGLKAALVVTASDRSAAAVAKAAPTATGAGLFGVLAAEAAFLHGEPWLDAVLAQLDANRTLLDKLITEQLPGVTWTPPQGTYLAWLNCQALGLGDDPSAAFLERGRVALGTGPRYGDPGNGFVRLNFGTSPEHVRETIRRMASVL